MAKRLLDMSSSERTQAEGRTGGEVVSDQYKCCLWLAVRGWRPVSSGDGEFVYWFKGCEICQHVFAGSIMVGAGLVLSKRWFWDDVRKVKELEAQCEDGGQL